MSGRLILTATVIAVSLEGVSGQAGTADGVAALARGDYQRAVEILKPIAEDWRTNDAAAQFFMAGLYEHGRGVPADPLRACALYARASSRSDNPFGQKAFALLAPMITRSQEFGQECQLLANVGFDHGFEPATFVLGPGHFVEWTLAAMTVTYDGRSKRVEMPLAFGGARLLPLQYTELATGPTRSQARHFLELFVWHPASTSGPWNLQWHVFEVVGDEVIGIDTPVPLVTVEGPAPPPRETFNVREYAVLRVDDYGNAEWVVLKGSGAAAQRIESDAERREARAKALARDAALKRVDWNRRADVNRQPALTYVDADGCGDVSAYGWTADRTEALVIRAAAQQLGLSTRAATFDLSRQLVNISVEVHLYAKPQRQFSYCSDIAIVGPDSIGRETWRAEAGTITIELSPPGIVARAPYLRRATITLVDVQLRNANGTTLRLSRPVTLTATVGGMGG